MSGDRANFGLCPFFSIQGWDFGIRIEVKLAHSKRCLVNILGSIHLQRIQIWIFGTPQAKSIHGDDYVNDLFISRFQMDFIYGCNQICDQVLIARIIYHKFQMSGFWTVGMVFYPGKHPDRTIIDIGDDLHFFYVQISRGD